MNTVIPAKAGIQGPLGPRFRGGDDKAKPLLEVAGLKKHFPIHTGVFSRVSGQVYAVDGISFHIDRGETLGLVGESGCGKSTAGRTLLKLLEPTGGEKQVHGESNPDLRHGRHLPYPPATQQEYPDPTRSLHSLVPP